LKNLLFTVMLTACADPRRVEATLNEAKATQARNVAVQGKICAPAETANAEADIVFTELEFAQGDLLRAKEHADAAKNWSTEALAKSTPCGTVDTDADGLVDVIDQCPSEKEDKDGDRDDDGCRDLDPNGDEDKDGVVNIDDACVDDAEDFDGDKDEDGCPETSTDQDGDTIIDAVDKCPTETEDLDGFKDSDGCPDPDNDADKVIDIRDACPKVAEDPDGFEDSDGCPDPDNDADGIPDSSDSCPNAAGERASLAAPGAPAGPLNGCPVVDADKDGVSDAVDKCVDKPETVNGYLDDDGCPDGKPPTHVRVTNTQIEITEKIQFETGKSTLLPVSRPILDDVVQVMRDRPDLRVRVEGHTDDQGSDDQNLKLSQGRAEAVRAYLISKGIEAKRLTALGLGETMPIDTNRTNTGRARNRRVEFHIEP
jgi:OOP family OmpA-OmpF porin